MKLYIAPESGINTNEPDGAIISLEFQGTSEQLQAMQCARNILEIQTLMHDIALSQLSNALMIDSIVEASLFDNEIPNQFDNYFAHLESELFEAVLLKFKSAN